MRMCLLSALLSRPTIFRAWSWSLFLFALACANSRPVSQKSFRNDCSAFESIHCGAITTANLRDRVLLQVGDETEPIPGAQVAANVTSGAVYHSFSDEFGVFDLPELERGAYEVWTCQDGFDESRFTLVIDREKRSPRPRDLFGAIRSSRTPSHCHILSRLEQSRA